MCMKQRNYTKNKSKKIKSDNFKRSNREKSNIAVAILENFRKTEYKKLFCIFRGTNMIFADLIFFDFMCVCVCHKIGQNV